MSFAETLAALRQAAGMTQVQLALKAEVPIDTLRHWEQGRNLPQIDSAHRLATALGVDLGRLVRESDMKQAAEGAAVDKGRPRKKRPARAAAGGARGRKAK